MRKGRKEERKETKREMSEPYERLEKGETVRTVEKPSPHKCWKLAQQLNKRKYMSFSFSELGQTRHDNHEQT